MDAKSTGFSKLSAIHRNICRRPKQAANTSGRRVSLGDEGRSTPAPVDILQHAARSSNRTGRRIAPGGPHPVHTHNRYQYPSDADRLRLVSASEMMAARPTPPTSARVRRRSLLRRQRPPSAPSQTNQPPSRPSVAQPISSIVLVATELAPRFNPEVLSDAARRWRSAPAPMPINRHRGETAESPRRLVCISMVKAVVAEPLARDHVPQVCWN